jgi:hypothetical protein
MSVVVKKEPDETKPIRTTGINDPPRVSTQHLQTHWKPEKKKPLPDKVQLDAGVSPFSYYGLLKVTPRASDYCYHEQRYGVCPIEKCTLLHLRGHDFSRISPYPRKNKPYVPVTGNQFSQWQPKAHRPPAHMIKKEPTN